ncbi:hypothetical protein FPT12_11880 [Pseudomonas sp. H3(2019)]|nr:hypothetical protein FPT12_11880 [Pseudomonas sp. H3(2019)]
MLLIVPTLCVGTPLRMLCVRFCDAERHRLHSHAERGNESFRPLSTIQSGNCGKQYSQPVKARHKAAANSCFSTVLTCPRLLWNWLWVTWEQLLEGL